MLHIVGVSHFAHLVRIGQTEHTERQKEFSSCLMSLVSQIKPAFVGEEASAEGLADHNHSHIYSALEIRY